MRRGPRGEARGRIATPLGGQLRRYNGRSPGSRHRVLSRPRGARHRAVVLCGLFVSLLRASPPRQASGYRPRRGDDHAGFDLRVPRDFLPSLALSRALCRSTMRRCPSGCPRSSPPRSLLPPRRAVAVAPLMARRASAARCRTSGAAHRCPATRRTIPSLALGRPLPHSRHRGRSWQPRSATRGGGQCRRVLNTPHQRACAGMCLVLFWVSINLLLTHLTS